MTSTTAPRTPETERIFDCLNDSNAEADLANDIALRALTTAQTAYDDALKEKADAESTVEQKRSEVAAKEADIAVLKANLENARKLTASLELRFTEANDKVAACN